VGIFALTQGALALALHYWLPQLRDARYGAQVQRLAQRVSTAPEARVVVMLGSSRTQWGFLAGQVEEPLGQALGRPVIAYNLGVASGGPVRQLLQLRQLRRRGVSPDLVLLEVLPIFLSGAHEGGEQQMPTETLQWSDLSVVQRYTPRDQLHRDWLLGQLMPCYTYRRQILLNGLPRWLPPEVNGNHGPLDATPSGDLLQYPIENEHTARRRQELLQRGMSDHADLLAHFQLGGQGTLALGEALEFCRRRGWPTALVFMPEAPAYRRLYPPATWQTIQAHVQELACTYQMPVVDARAWVAEEGFGDCHHLLKSGAACFTNRLRREYLERLLRDAGRSSPLALVQ
jgi:hypothetical protein